MAIKMGANLCLKKKASYKIQQDKHLVPDIYYIAWIWLL